MVLKRFVIMALGALGLGALTAGPTVAQQIPAPDAYGDPQACAASIKAVTAAADTGKVGDNGLTPTQTAALTNMARSCAGDVGGGIAKARTLWQAAVDAKAELDAAEKAYEADDSARNLEKRDEANGAHINAVAARNAHSGGGTIYEAVYAEEDRKAAATEANSAWMKAYAAAQAAETLRDTVELENYITDFAGFDSTGQAYEFETYTVKTMADDDTTADVDETMYTTYVRVKKQGGATVGLVRQDPEDPESSLIVPPDFALTKVNPDGTDDGAVSFSVRTIDHDLDTETDEISFLEVTNQGVTEDSTISGVNADYKMAKKNLAAAEKTLAGNQDGTQTIQLTEDVRRAQAQYNFFAAQKGRVENSLAAGKLVVDRMGDDPATPNEVETNFDLQDTPYTVEDYEGLTDLQGAATDAADDLKAAYDDRVAATNDLEANQRDTQQYLDQLVLLRKSQKAAADAAAPDDAEEDTAAQKAANENLATAEAQLASFNELQALDDANPVKALVNALVEADASDGDDDGQALVDAISSNHETASDAKSAADRLATQVEALSGTDGAVAALTAEDDPTTEDVDETGPITANTNRSTSNEGAIAALTAVDDPATEDMDETGVVTQNSADIDLLETEDGRLEGRIDTNWGAIAALTAVDDPATEDMDETGPVTQNSADIDLLEAEDVRLEGRIDTNWGAIAVNQMDIDANEAAIAQETMDRTAADEAEMTARMEADTAEAAAREMADTALGGRIDTNVTNIAGNTTAIMAEQTARMEADTMLGGRIDTNAEGIMTNAGNIVGNEMRIIANESAIGTNTSSIGANAANITANSRNISGNTAMIGELSESLEVVRAGVAASMALAGMPAINGRGISIGVGSFDGESAFALGFQIQSETTSFKIGVTSSGGATGASAGVGFQF